MTRKRFFLDPNKSDAELLAQIRKVGAEEKPDRRPVASSTLAPEELEDDNLGANDQDD